MPDGLNSLWRKRRLILCKDARLRKLDGSARSGVAIERKRSPPVFDGMLRILSVTARSMHTDSYKKGHRAILLIGHFFLLRDRSKPNLEVNGNSGSFRQF
jgi:hypothetical protein